MHFSFSIYRRAANTALATAGLFLWFGLASCGVAGAAATPVPVKTFTVEQRTVPEWSEYHGVVASRNSVNVIALVMGRIKAVHVKAGQWVRKGELLVEMESAELQAKLDLANARLTTAEANLAALDTAEVNQPPAAPSPLRKSAQAALLEAKTLAEEARTVFEYTKLKSPMNGVVIDKQVNPGDFTIPGLPAELGYPAGRILMMVYDPTALWFEARIPERFSKPVTVGAKAIVTIPAEAVSLEGRFSEVLNEVDAASRTFTARIDLPVRPALKLGMLGTVRFASGQIRQMEVPENSVVERGQLDAVFVLADGHARLRLVRSGKHVAGKVAILSGLAAGEKIILNPPDDLRDGTAVSPAP